VFTRFIGALSQINLIYEIGNPKEVFMAGGKNQYSGLMFDGLMTLYLKRKAETLRETTVAQYQERYGKYIRLKKPRKSGSWRRKRYTESF
jgi:hypothetical protein